MGEKMNLQGCRGRSVSFRLYQTFIAFLIFLAVNVALVDTALACWIDLPDGSTLADYCGALDVTGIVWYRFNAAEVVCEGGSKALLPVNCDNGIPPGPSSPGDDPNANGSAGLGAPSSPPVTCGSIIRPDSMVLQERIPIVGAPFSLVYSSDKVPGNLTWYSIHLPLTSSGISGSLVDVYATVSITTGQPGCSSTTTISHDDSTPANNDYWDFTWNGLDSCSNNLKPGFVLPYTSNITETNSPANPMEGNDPVTGYIGTAYVNAVAGSGWDVSIHHTYDSVRNVLYLGDGTSYSANPFTSASYSGYTIVMSQDGSEAYFFNSSNQHIYTKTGLVGATKYTFAYDGSNNLWTITDAYSNVTTLNYTSGHLTSISAPYGQSTSISNSGGYISAVTNPNSETYNMTYYSGGLLETFEKPTGTTNTMTYDTIGRLTEDSSSAGSSDSLGFTYGDTAWTSNESSAMSRSSSHVVTPLSFSSTTYNRTDTDPAGYYGSYVYQPGSSVYYLDVLGYSDETTPTTDARFGSSFQFTNSESIGQSGSYTSSKSATQSATLGTGTDPFSVTAYEEDYSINGNDSSLAWSSGTNKYTYTSPEGRYFYRVIDGHERTSSTQLAGLTALTYSYDGNGRLDEIQQGGSRTTTFSYYSSGGHKGLLESVEDAASHTTTFDYDSAGRVNSETLPDTRVIGFTYDSNGNLYTVTPPGKSAHTLNHNGFDLLSSYVTPSGSYLAKEEQKATTFIDRWGQKLANLIRSFAPSLGKKTKELFTGQTTTYAYNDDRQLQTITRPDTNTITFDYNSGTGVLDYITIPTGTNYYSFSYGKLPSVNSSLDSVAQNFSWSGYLLSSSNVDFENTDTYTGSVNYTYTNDFLKYTDVVASNGTPTGTTITYGYDGDLLLTSAGDLTVTRDPDTGFVTEDTIGNNFEEDLSYTTDYGELSDITAKYSGTTKYEEAITRDAVGRVHQKVENYLGTSHTYVYTYDSAGRLETVTKDSSAYESYGYDSNSNINSWTGPVANPSPTPSYTALDSLDTWGTKSYTFSSSGELEEVSDSAFSPAHVTDYTYDALGNLKSVTLPSSDVISYTVDANNRRTSKLTNSSVDNYFVWGSNNELLAMLDSSGNIVQRYVYGTKSNVPDYILDSSSNEYKIVSNHLGSPVLVIRQDTGTVEEEIQYDDYGNITYDSSPGYQPFGFAGCLYDTDTKLCHFGGGEKITTGSNSFGYNAGRDYDASTGRWNNRDPILFDGGSPNLFGYAMQDPVNFVDPTGQNAMGPIIIAGVVLTGGAIVLTVEYFTNPAFRQQVNDFIKSLNPSSTPEQPGNPYKRPRQEGYPDPTVAKCP